MRIKDDQITKRLAAIRHAVGGQKVKFSPAPFPRRILKDKDLDTIESITKLFHPSGLLVDQGVPVFVYIRDNTFHTIHKFPEDGNRVHFFVCDTLERMQSQGRFKSRYRQTNRDDNLYWVDTRSGGLHEKPLWPCKYCLGKIRTVWPVTDEMCQESDAKEIFPELKKRLSAYREFREKASTLRSDSQETGYSYKWASISKEHKKDKGYNCEECGVNLSRYRNLLEIHHIDGDKSNNTRSNHRCLCKLCHANEHPHMNVPEHEKIIIEKARREQGIP